MRTFVGTSGFSYKEWKGSFFPSDLPSSEMLRFYGERFNSVEINNSFYRMPSSAVLGKWAEEVPSEFVFVLKAPRSITHQKQLHQAGDGLAYFWKTAQSMGPKLGPILFQLPPFFRKDLPRLRDFVRLLPDGCRAAFEFRHSSWFDEEVYEALRSVRVALCAADTDELEATLVPTTEWGYLRLRRTDYGEPLLRSWAERIRSQPWSDAFVFF
ncbi:MAG TPA: DUF72 domain-containing protein, partial [Myxococcaceae bacterium]|nr:DUF72 domain-containing protein [Myxococcaceae bacterium]